MKSYLKIFAPFAMAIVIGSLTFNYAQTKTDTNGQFPKGNGREFGRMPPPFGFAPTGLNPRSLEQISLTDEQKTQINKLQENARSSSEVYFEKLQVIQEKIKDTTEGESFDESAARKLLKTRSEIQTELDIIRLKTDSAIFNLLTAEQIAKLDLLKQQRLEFPPQDDFRPPQN
jgi:Spy/CpxP family protein refolding chaperone